MDEVLGLSTLRAILSVGEVNKRRIQPEDWDWVWELIPMRVQFMIPIFMQSGSIHVDKPRDLYFTLGGKLNNRVAQILLFEQEQSLPDHIDFEDLKELMDHPRPDTITKEKHKLNSMSVLMILARLVPLILDAWAEREVQKNGGDYSFPSLLVFLHLAGWNPQTPEGRIG